MLSHRMFDFIEPSIYDKFKIACDVCVSEKAISMLRQRGYCVVYKAGEGEQDHLWFDDAASKGANLFVFHDYDIQEYVNRYGLRGIRMRQDLRQGAQGEYILARIKELK